MNTPASQTYTMHLGPQHPSTHGVLHIVVDMDGEYCVGSKTKIGYLHRGMEKLAESRTYPQVIPYTDRLDYLAGMSNNLAYVLAVEQLMGITAPPRAQYIRMITAELMRIASHMVGIGIYIMDLGAVTGAFYPFQLRERILEILGQISGARMTFNYIRIGGVAADLNEDFYKQMELFFKELPAFMKDYHQLVDENEIFVARTKNVGKISQAKALNYGLTGPNLRATGVDYDLRRDRPYCLYGKYDIHVPIAQEGDCYARYIVRMQEVEESFRLIKLFLQDIPAGPIMAKVPKIIKPPVGDAYHEAENPKGILGCYIVSDGSVNPYRVHFRRPSFANIAIYDELFIGYKMADLVAISASFDIVLGEIDA